ncbi:MAG: YtoQ family protein [Nitrospirae bacterium]|nr:YtoQ family protein [Candidatus Manganitrophaceae bacterium]
MEIIVYLSGEIHSDWRDQIKKGAKENNLSIRFVSAVTDHEASDSAGDVLGENPNVFWRDHQSAKINRIRTKIAIEESDLVVICFGDKYKQWNAAFDAGYCAALDKPYITLHDEKTIHPLKEVDAAAMAWAKTPMQVVEILKYVTKA